MLLVSSYVCLTHAYLMSWKSKPTFCHCYISFRPVAVLPIPNGALRYPKKLLPSRDYINSLVAAEFLEPGKLGWCIGRCINISNKSNKVIEGAICRCFRSVKYAADSAVDRKWVLLKATSQRRQNFCLKARGNIKSAIVRRYMRNLFVVCKFHCEYSEKMTYARTKRRVLR